MSLLSPLYGSSCTELQRTKRVLGQKAEWGTDLKVGGSTPIKPPTCHRVVSLDKKLNPTLSLSIQV